MHGVCRQARRTRRPPQTRPGRPAGSGRRRQPPEASSSSCRAPAGRQDLSERAFLTPLRGWRVVGFVFRGLAPTAKSFLPSRADRRHVLPCDEPCICRAQRRQPRACPLPEDFGRQRREAGRATRRLIPGAKPQSERPCGAAYPCGLLPWPARLVVARLRPGHRSFANATEGRQRESRWTSGWRALRQAQGTERGRRGRT